MFVRFLLAAAVSLWPILADAQADVKAGREACGSADAKSSLSACTQVIEAAAGSPPSLAAAYVNRGIAYRQLKEHYSALADYNKAIELEPASAKAYFNRGIANKAVGRWQPARADFDQAIRLDRSYAKAYAMRAATWSATENAEDFDALQASLYDLISAQNLDAALNLEWNMAIQALDRAVEKHPGESRPHMLLCLALASIYVIADALPECDAAKSLAKTDIERSAASEVLGYALVEAGDIQAALQALTYTIGLDGTALSAYVYRASAYQRLQDAARAVADLRTATRLTPRHERDWRSLEAARAALAALLNEPPVPTGPPWSPGAAQLTKALQRSNRACLSCPALVSIKCGSFTMGVPRAEEERENYPPSLRGNSEPVHPVNVRKNFLIGKYEVTRREFALFVGETNYQTGEQCYTVDATGKWANRPASWRDAGFPQSDFDPVVCISWAEASAYVDWLKRKTGNNYRLPTEAEWEYAARGGSSDARYWGATESDACQYGNVLDNDAARMFKAERGPGLSFACNDGAMYTTRVGRYRPNAIGLHDTLGNVSEWVGDCWQKDYVGASANGDQVQSAECTRHVYRGGGWDQRARAVRVGARWSGATDHRNGGIGFRVAMSLY